MTSSQEDPPTELGKAIEYDYLTKGTDTGERKDTEDKEGDLLKDLMMLFGSRGVGVAGTAVERETADRTTQIPEGAVKTEDVKSLITPLHPMDLEPAVFKGRLDVWGAVPRPKGHPAASADIGKSQVTTIIILSLAQGGDTSRARLQRRVSSSCGVFVARMGVKSMLTNMMDGTIMVKWGTAMHGGHCHVELRPGPCTVRLRTRQWNRRGSKRGESAEQNAVVNDTAMPPAPGRNSSRCWSGAAVGAPTRRRATEGIYRIGANITFSQQPWTSLSSSGSGASPFTRISDVQVCSHRCLIAKFVAAVPVQGRINRPRATREAEEHITIATSPGAWAGYVETSFRRRRLVGTPQHRRHLVGRRIACQVRVGHR